MTCSGVCHEALLELGDAGAYAKVGGLEDLVHCLDLGSGDVGCCADSNESPFPLVTSLSFLSFPSLLIASWVV